MKRLLPIAVLLAGVTPLTAATSAPTDGVITLAPDTEARWIPFDLTPGNQIRFRMTVDGKPITAILDTGVSYSVLAKRSAAADASRIRANGSATAIGGTVPIGWIATRTIALGGLERTGGGFNVAELPPFATGSATAVDLLVGRDITGGQALDIDFPNRRFRLLASGRMPFRGAVAPLTISPGRHLYESAITLGGRRLAPIVIDTGDGSTITISASAWRAAAPRGIDTTSAVSFGVAGPTVTAMAIVPDVRVGGNAGRDAEVRIEPQGGFSDTIGVAGRIGSGFLQRYRVLLDPVAGHMVLSPGKDADDPPLRSTSGLLVGIEAGATPARLKVLHVMRGGPAQGGGWRDGDEICSVDGQPIATDYAASPLARWSVGVPGRIVHLGLCGGATRALILRRFY
ncbi:MAG: aspartyl protease family protein [Pseudomonadota bacterium]|nr:aspartyl protease family protein [Pseudomonadota bacterium]